ncbi:MAG: ferrochelatase [Legionellales bacterium]|nr:ferrochelatase [Legionellales bacterium]
MRGILLTNLGTPDAPTPPALRRYLAEFLSDTRVVEIPRIIWWPILHGIILRLRPQRSAKLYQSIWQEAGSPLLVYSRNIQRQLQQQFGDDVIVELGMRYGNPSLADALTHLRAHQVTSLTVLPLYPQYSAATHATTFDKIASILKTWRFIPNISMIMGYHDQPQYIKACAQHIAKHCPSSIDLLVFSFHGLPERCVRLGDPYQQQCLHTAELIAKQLALSSNQWRVVFQSRFGKAKWLQPYCDKTLETLPSHGIKNIAITCPGFAADCLETLQEIQLENRHIFMEAGGESFHYIPALNAGENHIKALKSLCNVNECNSNECSLD